MSTSTQYAHLDSQDLYATLVRTARERMAVRKGAQPFTEQEALQQLFRDDPSLYALYGYRVQGGTGLHPQLRSPVAKADLTPWQAYAPLDAQETQTRLLQAAHAEAITKGHSGRSDHEVLSAYFTAHPQAYALYTYKVHGGASLPVHLRASTTEIRKRADEIVLFRKVVDDEVARLRRLDTSALQRALVAMARESVRKSDELKDVSDAFALEVLFSYRDDLYQLWQEKQAA